MGANFAFLGTSTKTGSEKIKWEDGQEYPVIKVDISSASHPFFTGKLKLIDAEGRVDRFMKNTVRNNLVIIQDGNFCPSANASSLERKRSKVFAYYRRARCSAYHCRSKKFSELSKEHASLQSLVENYRDFMRDYNNYLGSVEVLENEKDPDLLAMAKEDISSLEPVIEKN